MNGSKDPGSPRTEAMPAHRRTAACADQAALKTSVRSSMLSRGTSAGAVGSSDIWPFVRMRASVSKQVRNCAADLFAKVRFAVDSPLEGDGFEPSVPQQICSRFLDSSPVSHDGLATRNRKFRVVYVKFSKLVMVTGCWFVFRSR